MKKLILLGTIALSLGIATSASAAIIKTYADTTIHWKNYENGTADDVNDDIGNPEISSMTITTNDRGTTLRKVELSFATPIPDSTLFSSFNKDGNHIRDGLFINTDSSSTRGWDYYIRGVYNGNPNNFTYNLYSVSANFKADNYIRSNDISILDFGSYRELHPVGIEDVDDTGAKILTGLGEITVKDSVDSLLYKKLFDLDDKIKLTENYAISYMNACANDVIVAATPIPAPFLLFGSALLGVFGFNKFKKETA